MSEKTVPSTRSPPNIIIVRCVKSGLLRRGASVGDVRANEFLVENHEFRPSNIELRQTAYLIGRATMNPVEVGLEGEVA